jgi:hypothetical protein
MHAIRIGIISISDVHISMRAIGADMGGDIMADIATMSTSMNCIVHRILNIILACVMDGTKVTTIQGDIRGDIQTVQLVLRDRIIANRTTDERIIPIGVQYGRM